MRALTAISIGLHVVTLIAAAAAFGIGVHHDTFAATDTDDIQLVAAPIVSQK